ncbi:hypothetical protein [Massilia sp. BSC265]|uniref:hypothetical protein n=1 Tax=Massilia sp. BSC265 TaxID=1549812 RepID=UPI00068AAC35|nr:hypothetical protein [Massilia sp. BSC265]
MNKKILLAALLACAFAPALAGEMGFEEEPRVRIVTRELHGDGINFADGVGAGAAMVHMSRNRLVKNAPYSAEMVSERTQTLGDGNQIVRKTSTMSYRDSAGRTRTEVRNEGGEVLTVMIHDPVEGVHYVLRTRDKTAIKMPMPNATAIVAREQARAAAAQGRVAADQARIKIEELRREGKLPEGERFIIKQVERSGGATGEHKDVQIRIAQAAGPQAAARVAPVLAGALGDRKWASKTETKDLGTREFSGLKATGVQRSYEIPAGEIGNRNPIVVSTETWTSPELQAVVYQKRSDPRSGEVVYRAENLKREEPAAALFTVPSDYTVKDSAALAREAAEKAAARARVDKNG